MSKTTVMRLPVSPIKALLGGALLLMLTYVALIAMVMNYAALTVGFAQSVRNDEAKIASLEATYFSMLSEVTKTDYAARGYAKPIAQVFVPSAPATALR
ncbi:MAG TPA: hypothetical protein VM103_00435 [Candidatus Paceibacterota bacterium]|nr:hypothetical protein [Candidatus Paceibacterota bacterium]